MADNATEKSFFTQSASLKIEKANTGIKYDRGSLDELLGKFSIDGKVTAHCMNELKFGYYTGGKFVFADASALDVKYLLQLRIFNADQELLLQRDSDIFQARYITDTPDDSGSQEYVDSGSPLFGGRDTAAKLPQGFVRLVESGRKISMIIPAEKTAKNYLLITRSYITYDAKTGQAGYGFWRFVAIEAR